MNDLPGFYSLHIIFLTKGLKSEWILSGNSWETLSITARAVLRSLKQTSNEITEMSGEPISFFLDEITRVILDWMAAGEVEQIRYLLNNLHKVLNDEAEDINCLDSLSPNKQLTVRLQDMGRFMATFLRTGNLSKYMGLIVGKRRVAWRNALQWIYEHNRPVRANELYNVKLFNSDSTASNALNQLTSIGLLEKRTEDSQAAIYDLTWAGRSVCRALSDEGSQQHKVVFAYISEERRIQSGKVQETLSKKGFWSIAA